LRTFLNNPYIGEARVVALNKAHPNISKREESRPITVLSPLWRFVELRFLEELRMPRYIDYWI
jgi:hypothetical protein